MGESETYGNVLVLDGKIEKVRVGVLDMVLARIAE